MDVTALNEKRLNIVQENKNECMEVLDGGKWKEKVM